MNATEHQTEHGQEQNRVRLDDLVCLIESARRLKPINVGNARAFRKAISSANDEQLADILRGIDGICITCRALGLIRVPTSEQ